MRKLIRLSSETATPRAKAGEHLLIDDSLPINPGDEVFVMTIAGECLFKELVSRDGSTLTLRNVHNEHGEVTIAEADIESIAYVGGIVRRSTNLAALYANGVSHA